MSTHSSRRTQITVALTCVLLFSVALIGWMELGGYQAAPQTQADIGSIIIKRDGHADITLVKTGSVWNMTTPYELVANSQRINPLLSLGTAIFDGYDKTEVDMSAAGLDTPAASITIGTREFLLGANDVDGERRYTLIDDKVSFVPGWVWSLVHGGVTAFSDLSVFSQLPDDIYLFKDDNITKLKNVEQWAALQADKISAWPNESAPLAESRANNLVWQLSASNDPNKTEPLATLIRLEDRTLINTQPGFAFAISNARLDNLLNQ